MLLVDLEKRELIKPPTFLSTNTMYLTRMGSTAYGVSSDNSDIDIYGVCIPPRDYIFPPNYIDGFDNRDLTFHQWQQHHVKDKSANSGKGCEYDFSIYSIVNYFKLVMENNPNTLDSLFVKREQIIHITKSWENVRENRKLFLHKGVAHKMKGYAYSQLNKAKNANEYVKEIRKFEEAWGIPHEVTYEQAVDSKYTVNDYDYADHDEYIALWKKGMDKTTRFESQKRHGFDPKFLYHVYRLVSQAEYILTHHDLDLQEYGRVEKMKAIRRGDISYDEIVRDFGESEARLNGLYNISKLQHSPDTRAIRNLLLVTLEDHYGSLSAFIKTDDVNRDAIKEIKCILQKYNI